jgi:hypothetical protein
VGGAVVALPFLETFTSRKAVAQAEAEVPRYAIFVRQGNGVAQATNDEPERYWPSQQPGPLDQAALEADTGRALSELAPHASRISIVRGLRYAFPGNGCGHSGGGNQCLTAARVSDDPAGNESLATGESIDNRIAGELGADGATEPLTLYVGRKLGYLDEVLSYRNGYELRAAENNPYNVYQDLFGLSGTDPDELERLRRRRQSVNDLVRGEMSALLQRSDLSSKDRERLDRHFSAIRDLETGIICGLGESAIADLEAIQANVQNDDYWEDVCRLQMDLVALTMACGVRRAATIQLGCGNDQTQYWIDGVKQKPFHKISHRIDSDGSEGPPIPDADVLHHKIDRLLLSKFRYLLDKLSEVDLGETGTLLDAGVAVMTNDLSNKWHSYDGVPFILAGGARGALNTGLYVDAGGRTHDAILNTIGAAVGCTNGSGAPLDDFGDDGLAGGRIDALVAS